MDCQSFTRRPVSHGSSLLVVVVLWSVCKGSIPTKPHISEGCQILKKEGAVSINCSGQSLKEVPQDLPPDTKILDLSYNNISILPSNVFHNVTNLTWLSLRSSAITHIFKGAFTGLHNLTFLDLGYNNLCYQNCSAGIFQDLHALTTLYFNSLHCEHTVYPDYALADLSALKELYLVGVHNTTLGAGFMYLQSLERLVFYGKHCNLGSISEEMFIMLQNISLKELNIQNCELHFMAPSSLKWLTTLNTLVIQCARIGLDHAATITRNILSPNLETLVLDGVGPYDALSLFTKDQFYANSTRTIKHLSLRANKIIAIDIHVLECFPNLQSLNLGYNSPISLYPAGTNDNDAMIMIAIADLYSLPITSLDISHIGDESFAYMEDQCSSDHEVKTFFRQPPSFITVPTTIPLKWHNNSQLDPLLNVPPTLLFLYGDAYVQGIQSKKTERTCRVDAYNNIVYINMSKTHMFFLPHIEGLHQLQGADIHGCHISLISNDSFRDMPSLTYLNLRSNNLGHQGNHLEQVFKFSSNLTFLDLSDNGITHLHPDTFIALKKLQELHLSWNRLQSVQFHVGPLYQLQFLDLSHNLLSRFQAEFVEELKGEGRAPGMFIQLQGNQLVCDCNSLDWLELLLRNQSFIIDISNVSCDEKGKILRLPDLHIPSLTQECELMVVTKNHLTIVSAVLLSIVVAIITIMITWVRFKWVLRKHMYLLKQRVRIYFDNNHNPMMPINDKPWDAFVAHNHDHEVDWVTNFLLPKVEEDWQLNLCVGYRDFMAGEPIAENIINAISQSRKVILLVTPAFSTSQWCEFEMQMALTMKGLKGLIVCYMKDTPIRDMSATLQQLVESQTYIPWTDDENGRQLFWQKLKDALENHNQA